MLPPSPDAAPPATRRSVLGLRRGLTLQFFLFVILPLTVALVAVALVSQWLHQDAMRSMVAERDARTIAAAAAALDAQLAERGRWVEALAQNLQAAPDSDAQELLLEVAAASFDGGLAVVGPSGTLEAAVPDRQAWSSRPVATLLSDLPPAGAGRYSSAFLDPDGTQRVLVGARLSDGRVVVAALAPDGLAQRILSSGAQAGTGMSWLLVDAAGTVLFHQGTLLAEFPAREHPGVQQALQGASGTYYLAEATNQEHVVAYSAVPTAGWALLSEEPWDAVESPFLRNTLLAPLILIPAIVLALVVLAFGLREIVQPLRTLEQQAAELGQGHYAAIEQPVGGIAEIQRLQTALARMAAKVKSAQISLRGYLGAVTAGQEEERRRLARELHDDTVQALIALDQRAQLAQHAAKDASPIARARLSEVRTMTSGLIDHIRRVIRAMRPIYLEDLGLLPAIEMLARDVEIATGLPVAFTVSGPTRRLSAVEEIGLYRIVQEALNNTRRHAEAHSAFVSVVFDADSTRVCVSDDGRGFAVPERMTELTNAGHYGLMGIQERVDHLGGELRLISAPGQGTRVEVRIPCHPA